MIIIDQTVMWHVNYTLILQFVYISKPYIHIFLGKISGVGGANQSFEK